jgi:hypothetical protein
MVTAVLFQPFALACGAAVALIASGADCTLTVMVALAEFPALSVDVPLNDSFSPAVVTCTGEGQAAIPDRESEQVKLIVAGAVTTPLAFGAGVAEAVITGAVLSMLTLVETLAVLAFASVAVAVIVWFRPSVLTVCEAGHCTGVTPPEHV